MNCRYDQHNQIGVSGRGDPVIDGKEIHAPGAAQGPPRLAAA